MSNFLAIATVTATLSQILQSAVGKDVSGAIVTTLRPGAGSKLPTTGINLFLYQVVPNAAWRNADLPTRNSDGQLLQRPRVAIDLHYLLSFYGADAQLEPQRLLGSAARALHARSILTRELILKTVQDPSFNFLARSNLAEDLELIKITPLPLSLEELSKLWSVFFQTSYALSVAYQGTVVLIETEETPLTALPVRERRVHVMPLRQPTIENVLPQFMVPGGQFTIQGQGLKSSEVKLVFGTHAEVRSEPDKLAAELIEATLPAELRAGVNTVRVVHELDFGDPSGPHRGFESNLGVFVLRPVITATPENVTISRTVDGIKLKEGQVKVDFTPAVGKAQRVMLLLNQFNPPIHAPAHTYRFNAPSTNGITDPQSSDTTTIRFEFKDVVEGHYVARVQVDEAESALSFNPITSRYESPQVTI